MSAQRGPYSDVDALRSCLFCRSYSLVFSQDRLRTRCRSGQGRCQEGARNGARDARSGARSGARDARNGARIDARIDAKVPRTDRTDKADSVRSMLAQYGQSWLSTVKAG